MWPSLIVKHHVAMLGVVGVLCISCAMQPAQARSNNGNDFALKLSEAPSPQAQIALIEEAGRRPHFFRYLQVMEMEEGEERGRPYVHITAMEPASALDVQFRINQRVSLRILNEEPKTERGHALAVSGVITGVNPETLTIYLDPTIVRHKDRLSPVLGKEMLYEIDDRGRFYSFTGGQEIVSVSYRDRDLLRHRDRILEERGEQGWADFLREELRKREAARQAGESVP